MEMIVVRNVTKRYKRGKEVFTALDNVSMKINKGDFCSVTGVSGAGKSTLLYTIGGMIHPDSGAILYNGGSIYDQNSKYRDLYRKNDVGFIFQQFHLMPYLTVIENIQLGCSERSRHASINYYLGKCSLFELKHKYPSELSVGEKQRTAFVRAIISDPELLLADEPTGNLDDGNSIVIMSLLEEYHKNGGTVVLVSHDPVAGRYANLNITLDKGGILI